MFTAVVVALVMVILAARSRLVAGGNIDIEINGEKTIQVPAGGKLLQTLADADLFLASACGGGGTCAQCKCIVSEGGGTLLPTEESHFTRREANDGWRLSCQTPVKQDLESKYLKKYSVLSSGSAPLLRMIMSRPSSKSWFWISLRAKRATFAPAATCN